MQCVAWVGMTAEAAGEGPAELSVWVIWLHGLGYSGRGWSALQGQLGGRPALRQVYLHNSPLLFAR